MAHPHAHAHQGEKASIRVVTLTISDTRTESDDKSGAVLRDLLGAAGFTVVRHAIVPDDPARVRAEIVRAVDDDHVDAVVSTGGTGIAPRDQTYEAVTALLEKTLDGFGEAFRRLSWEEIGPRAVLSRAVAGTYHTAAIFALPGSTNAVRLGVEKLIIPMLPHTAALLRT
jgi:molybdenum cofactor biosynthesis protein B